MTANDFHKAIRNIYKQPNTTSPYLRIDDLVQSLRVEKEVLQDNLQTLEILDLVQFHDKEKEVFSLTESGRLSNLA